MWYRHMIYKIPDKRGCSLLTQPTFPGFDMTKWRQGWQRSRY